MALFRTIAAALIIALGVASVAFAEAPGLQAVLSATASSQVSAAPAPGA
ncbi:MAG: hypothetical protein AAGJ87_12020 [Pseudomonadota bacterium]